MNVPHSRTSRLVFALALLAMGLAPLAPAAAADPYVINAVMPLTGPASFLGKAEQDSLQLVEGLVNQSGGIKGRPVHFVVADDQSNPQVAVQLANGILAKGVPVIMGSSVVAMCSAMAALIKAGGPVQYCFSPGIHPAHDSFTFSASVSTSDLAVASLRYFRGRKWNKVALIASTDATGQDAERGFDEAFARPENKGMQMSVREHFTPSDVSVAAQMAHIKAAKPDVVVAWATGTPFGTLMRGLAENAIDVPVLGGNGNITYAQMKQYGQFLPKDLLFPGPRFLTHELTRPGPLRDAQTLFYASFKKAGLTPDVANSFSWDPALIVIDALRHLGTDAQAPALKKYISELHGWAGINGIYDFRDGGQRGLTENVAVIVRWDPAKNTWIGVSGPGGNPLK